VRLQGTAFAPHDIAREAAMDTFFVRKQLFVGAILLGVVEVGVLLVKAFAH
jgi:hypothetical protein